MTAPAPRPRGGHPSGPAAPTGVRPPSSSGPGARPRPQERTAVGYGGEVLTASMVESSIMKISNELEELVTDLANRAETAAQAEVTYKVKYAQKRLLARDAPGHGPGGRTSNDEADDRALRDCENELRAHLIAGALYGSLRDAMFTKGRQLEALRTIAANIRAMT